MVTFYYKYLLLQFTYSPVIGCRFFKNCYKVTQNIIINIITSHLCIRANKIQKYVTISFKSWGKITFTKVVYLSSSSFHFLLHYTLIL